MSGDRPAAASRGGGGNGSEGAGGTAELAGLVGRWKGASRVAAEELFGLVRARVEGMGGWRGLGAGWEWGRDGGDWEGGRDGGDREGSRDEDWDGGEDEDGEGRGGGKEVDEEKVS